MAEGRASKVMFAVSAALASAAGLAAPAHAQKLNLDGGPSALSPNTGKGARALAEQLEREAKEITTNRAQETAPEIADVKAGVRLFAAAVLRAGEGADEKGSVAILVGRTIAARLRAIELAIRSIADEPGGTVKLASVANDLAGARTSIPLAPEALDRRVRDALAQLAGAFDADDASVGWFPSSELVVPGQWPKLAETFDAATRKNWDALGERLDAGLHLAGYRDIATDDKRRALRAYGLVNATPGWMLPGAVQTLRSEFAAATKELASGESTGRLRFERLAMLADLIESVGKVEGNPGKSSKAGISMLCVSLKDVSDTSERKRLMTLVKAANAMAQGRAGEDEKKVLRQLRPALRSMLELAKIAEAELADAMSEGLVASDAISSPKLINALAAMKRRSEDIAMLVRASAVLADPTKADNAEPSVRDDLKYLAERVLELTKDALTAYRTSDAASRMRGDQKLNELRRLLGQTRDFLRFPAEDDLRAAAGDASATPDAMSRREAWTTLLDDRCGKLVKAVDGARKQWVRGWTRSKAPDEATVNHMIELRDAARALADAAEVEFMISPHDAPGAMAAMLWPGWEVSRDDLTQLGADLPARARALADTAIDSSGSSLDSATAAAVKKFRGDYAEILLGGRLNSVIRHRGLGLVPTRARALSEVVASPGTAAWLADRRQDLATVCRCIAEEAWAKSKSDPASRVFHERGVELSGEVARLIGDEDVR